MIICIDNIYLRVVVQIEYRQLNFARVRLRPIDRQYIAKIARDRPPHSEIIISNKTIIAPTIEKKKTNTVVK